MRHLKKGRKFGLKKGDRKAFLKVLAGNLIRYEKILTTEARAKELKSLVERLITYGKKKDLASLRALLQKLPKVAAHKIYHEISPRYVNRAGGYTRIVKQSKKRLHDNSKMATIEFIK